MENSNGTAMVRSATEGLSLAEAGQRADEIVAQSTFTRYRERKAPQTLRRHHADLALFTTYLHQIPGLQRQTIGLAVLF